MLGADGQKFDENWKDFDIVEAAVYAVAAAKPKSPVLLLTDGTKRLTAFAPTDKAFRNLAQDLTGKTFTSEKKVFTTLAGLVDVDTLELVLLYHVVPGATITAAKAVKADGAKLKTAAGKNRQGQDRQGQGHPCRQGSRHRERHRGRRRHQQGQQADRPRHRRGAAPSGPVTGPLTQEFFRHLPVPLGLGGALRKT